MMKPDWRIRLEEAVQASGRSPRSICIAAGLRPEWYSHIMQGPQEPTLAKFIKFCDGLNVSPAYILNGISITPEAEELLRLWAEAPAEARKAFLTLLSRE